MSVFLDVILHHFSFDINNISNYAFNFWSTQSHCYQIYVYVVYFWPPCLQTHFQIKLIWAGIPRYFNFTAVVIMLLGSNANRFDIYFWSNEGSQVNIASNGDESSLGSKGSLCDADYITRGMCSGLWKIWSLTPCSPYTVLAWHMPRKLLYIFIIMLYVLNKVLNLLHCLFVYVFVLYRILYRLEC
jgi:hypothetical protein